MKESKRNDYHIFHEEMFAKISGENGIDLSQKEVVVNYGSHSADFIKQFEPKLAELRIKMGEILYSKFKNNIMKKDKTTTIITIPKNNRPMAWIPLEDVIELKDFRKEMMNQNKVYVNEKNIFGTNSFYVSTDEKFKELALKLGTKNAIEKDLESEIQVLRNKIERLESMGLLQFLKKRYFRK